MEDLSNPINQKASILLSRNHPIALVVGAAGFLGSHLVERLLKLHIQVIGVDDLSTGRKENLTEAFKEKNFHFFNFSIVEGDVREYLADLPRLDYAFFVAENPVSSALYKLGLDNFLSLVLKYKDEKPLKKEHPKTVLVSSIDTYETGKSATLNFLKTAEEDFAKFSKTHALNARIVRLAEVYGPKMHFRHKGSVSRLIRAALEGKLIEEQTTLDFSSRGLFVDDAISLLIKAVLSGSTSGKIYDGCLMQPIKIAEIKQILLDPVWYKHRGFSPTELPPWPTPNLSKTMAELSWKPKTELIESLKQTLDFFDQDKMAKHFALEQPEEMDQASKKIPGWSFEQLEPKDNQKSDHRAKSTGDLRHLPKALFVVLLFIGIIFPFANFFMGSFYLPQNLSSAKRSFEVGEFEQSKKDLALAGINISQMQALTNFFLLLKNSSVWRNQLPTIVEYVDGQDLLVRGADTLLTGISQQLDNNQGFFSPLANDLYLQSEQDLSQSLASLSDPQLRQLKFIPNLDQALDLSTANFFYHNSQQSRVVNDLLPQLFPQAVQRSYLVVWQNNSYLSPSGGVLVAVARLNWANGKLSILDSIPISELEQKLALAGPLYTKKGTQTIPLNFSNLKDEANFASFGQYFLTLYQKMSGEVGNGVFLIDSQGLEALKQVVDGDVSPQAKLMLEGKEASRSGQAAQTLYSLTTNLAALSQSKVLRVAGVLGQQLDQKHLLIYSDNPKSLGLLNSQNWSTSLTAKDEGGNADFLQVNQNYLGGAQSKTIISSFNLQTQISSGGEVSHTLKISFQNNATEPAQNRLQLFLPLGTRLTRASLGGEQVLNKFNSLVDYGRAVYLTNLNLASNSSSELMLTYSLTGNLISSENLINYNLKISKQAGTGKDPLTWQLFLPEGWQAVNLPKEASLGSRGLEIKTDLSTDRNFDFSFKKP